MFTGEFLDSCERVEPLLAPSSFRLTLAFQSFSHTVGLVGHTVLLLSVIIGIAPCQNL